MTTTIPTVKKFPGIIIVSKPLTILRPSIETGNIGAL
jgi:hypothetical protein